MARKSLRNKFKELNERTQESYATRDSGGGMKNYFNNEKMEDISTWWAGKGDHIIDVIPYFAGNNDPKNKKGSPAYVLSVDVHRGVGPMEEMIVCPEQFGKPCPVCQERYRLTKENADYAKVLKPLKPSKRSMYNIIVRDGGDMEKKGVQIFEIAHWFMEKHLSKIAKDPRGDGFVIFSDPDDGRSISFERTGTGPKNTDYTGHRFVDRPDVISNEELEEAYCLDDLIEVKDYDEIFEIFFGEKNKEQDEDTPEPDPEDELEPEDEGEEDEGEEEPEPTPPKKSKNRKKRGKSRTPKCPYGHEIGEDIDEYDECDDANDGEGCEMYDKCNDIADTL